MDNAKSIIKFLLKEEEDDEDLDLVKDVMDDPPLYVPDAFDLWYDKYKPIKNPVQPNAPFEGEMFETYGPELNFVEATPPNRVWTLVTGDDGSDIITAGFHFVNRLGYFITEIPWTDETESVTLDSVDPE